ncbi:ATP-binding protein [Halocella sp. SP3-1]|uniref:ATP-binding protein n=1 Tax=Halocella sp. SP3-1 TaxID=2382161 RepID=UPI000F7534CE|nr:ATP-binding protein [Halocella sp. SP3-1]AZO95432.1 HAMP domain-containing protein [Halocella sp. SP3-1]
MLRKLKGLKTKIFIGYLLVAFILVIVTFWSIINFTNLSDAINNIMVENYQSIKASESMVESIERQDSAILVMINGSTEESGRKIFRQNEQEFYRWLARAEDNITIKGEAEILEKISSSYSHYINGFDEFYHHPMEIRWEYYNGEMLPLFETIKQEIRDLRHLNQKQMISAQEQADNRAEGAVISTSVISLIAILLAIVFGLYLSNQILKPVNKLKGAIQNIAEKNFEQKIEVYSNDEIGQLAVEFNKMIDRLQDYEKININKLIAEKEKSEIIVNNICSPIIVTDDENRVLLLNEAAKKLFDINLEVIDNYHFLEVIKNEELFELIRNEIDNQENNNKTLFIKKKNKERHYNVSSNKVRKDGKIWFTVTLMEDVTKLKKIDEMKSEFVSTVSHEFRTPLTSMNMGLSLLLEEDTGSINDDQRQLLEAAFEDCERLNDLVNDLLDLSKIESGKIKMEFDKTNVKKVIETTMKPFTPQAEDKGVKLVRGEVAENTYAWADPNKISWVISNLIGNALRYTPEDGSIEVGSFLEGRQIKIYVEDTGVGIAEEYHDKIFDKFVRASNNQDENSGTGLGLAISKEIIEAHNGQIWVEGKEGKGSKFVFTLPRYRHLSD